jgi:hypothetical protein
MQTVVDIAQIVAMFAALAAVWYSEGVVRESRALRREERIARLLELVADVGELGTQYARGRVPDRMMHVAQQRLRAAVTATGEPLPQCERLLAVEWLEFSKSEHATTREADGMDTLAAALDEVASLLVSLRAEGTFD